ncbi:hypothetical protein BZL54_23240 [Burkholderia ubonensis subsp. mesacidophila]|uniref:Conjugal transfer protein TraY n=1 Tax=Burkholderia ubonensis subsp. mesacidophila TaxID=265293 RepID=A0A2A4F8A6_9BURK|nr:hypothetical protein BZL54_23240 [Burkholderia ubonensis subsp. mesacidophila]
MGDIQAAANRGGDKSMSLLELVYGAVVHNPLAAGGGSGGMIAQLFMVLNSCILAVGVIWALYHFGSAMIATGQDGEFMGQKKSSPWFIIRMSVGFTGLVPIFGGYCGAQMIMLWGTMLGVGIANLSLDSALGVLKSGGSMIAAPASPQATTVAKALFEANLCAQSANKAIDNMPRDSGVSVDADEQFNVISSGAASNKVVLMNRRGLSCGGAEISIAAPPGAHSTDGMAAYGPESGAIYSKMLSAHQKALGALQKTLESDAKAYVSAINGQTPPADPQNTINQAALQYQATISEAIANSSNAISGLSDAIESNLKRDGWIMMGAWYQTFAQANSQVTALANSTASAVAGTNPDEMPYPQVYRKVMAAYERQSQRAASTATTPSMVDNLSTGSMDPKNVLSKIFSGKELVKMAINVNSGQGPAGTTNPLIGMKNLGDYILDAGWVALAAYAALKGIEGASESNAGAVVGVVSDIATGGLRGMATGAAKGILAAVAPFVVLMVITLFFFGATLSIYIPMLPFIIWFSGVVSWYAVVGESMVASPLWAVTHLDGDGDGMGQRPTHGYIFLLNVMFRPTFMVIGFVLAGAGIVVLGTLLNTMFGVAMQNAQYDSMTGLVSIIGFICLYVGLCQTLCNSAFSLIHIVPDQVFAWVGGQMSSRMSDMEERVNRAFGAGLGHGSQNARGAGIGKPRDPKPGRPKGASEGKDAV